MKWRRLLGTLVLVVLALSVLLYAGDYLVFKIRAGVHGNAYGSVTIEHYYAVQHKSGKTEFLFDPPAAQKCVNALFGHEGYAPCWYLDRHREPATNI